MDIDTLFASQVESLKSLKRIALIKEIEKVSGNLFTEKKLTGDDSKYVNAAIHQNFQGIPEFSEEFYHAHSLASQRQQITRGFVIKALDEIDHGFDDFDKQLIQHSARISNLYDIFYVSWLKAVRGNEVAKKLEAEAPSDKSLYNHYTIIKLADDGTYYQEPYAVAFATEFAPILAAFDAMIAALEGVTGRTDEQSLYIPFLKQYRASLAETNIDELDNQWKELDRKWMDVKYYIQIVHDIEYGYGDPLCIKAIPDYSMRFVDEELASDNETILKIQQHMVDWFGKRDAPLAKKGLHALGASFAAIYYIPFQSGMSLHFRFSGQSIPNRSDVKTEKGVKIYFDPVSTASRQKQTAELVAKAYNNDTDLSPLMTPIGTLVYHVAAHEVGHAIYGLDHVKEVIKASTKTLLEEPRAELTALFTMKLLRELNFIDDKKMQDSLISFALQDLRRFAMFTASSTRPYTISAINTYKTYQKTGFVTLGDNGKLTVDRSKAADVLDILSAQFFKILDAEDANDGAALEAVLEDMQTENDLIKHLVKTLTPSE